MSDMGKRAYKRVQNPNCDYKNMETVDCGEVKDVAGNLKFMYKVQDPLVQNILEAVFSNNKDGFKKACFDYDMREFLKDQGDWGF